MPKIMANGRLIVSPSWNGCVSLAGTRDTTPEQRIAAAQKLADGHAIRLGGVSMSPRED